MVIEDVMGVITCFANADLRARIYAEGAALPHRGITVLDEVKWDDNGTSFLTIITDQTPPGPAGRGHYDAYLNGDRVVFKNDRDV